REQEDEAVTPAQIWEEIFSVLTTSDVRGMHILGGTVSGATYETEGPCYICAFTSGSLKEMRRIYRKLSQDAGVSMYLTATKPFLQSNELEQIQGLVFYGKVQRDGSLRGGDADFFGLHVHKRRGKRSHEAKGVVFLLAPEGIEGRLTSKQIIQRLTIAIRRYFPGSRVLPLPLMNGEAGTVDALLSACPGIGRTVQVNKSGAEKVSAHYAVLRGKTAVIEMPQAFAEPNGERGYASFGIGQLVRRALDEGLSEIIISNSKSAIADLGLGCLQALGVKFLDAAGEEITSEFVESAKVAKIDMELAHSRLEEVKFTVTLDKAPLEEGVAALLQSMSDAKKHSRSVEEYREKLCTILHQVNETTRAAVGLVPMLFAVLHASVRMSDIAFLEVAEFNKMVQRVSLVITSISGEHAGQESPAGNVIAKYCKTHGVPIMRLFAPGHMLAKGSEENKELRETVTSLYMPLLENIPGERMVDVLDALCDRAMRLLKMGTEIKRV
ncbi:glycerate kinase, partial [Christensenellaceae bacterium OttesenSCG-928-L17]|nr:glycerate kinase [Christensenellaceae bacterium OttesenSCG-928-L17]